MSTELVNKQIVAIIENNTYLKALATGTQLKNLSVFEKKSLLADCIAVAIFNGGWATKEDNDIVMLINSLMTEVCGRLSGMTDLEVKTAFDQGAKGAYGENHGISPAACLKWLDTYHQHSNRKQAQEQLAKLIQSPPRQPLTREEKQIFINDAFQKYCFHDAYKDYGNLVYNWLDEEGLITYTAAEKRDFLEAGRKLIYNRLNDYKSLDEKRQNDKKITELMDNDNEPIAEGKRLALLDFFKWLKLSGVKKITFKN